MAEFGIKEETPQKNESAAIKSGKSFIEKVKGDRKLQIILAVVVVLLVLGVVVGKNANKNKVFGISPNMSAEQAEKVLGSDTEIEIEDGIKTITKENVKWGDYVGTLSVSVREEDNKKLVMWAMDQDDMISEPELMKMLESNYGKNQVEQSEDMQLFENFYESDFGAWEVSAWAWNATYSDVLEYGGVTINWMKQ